MVRREKQAGPGCVAGSAYVRSGVQHALRKRRRTNHGMLNKEPWCEEAVAVNKEGLRSACRSVVG